MDIICIKLFSHETHQIDKGIWKYLPGTIYQEKCLAISLLLLLSLFFKGKMMKRLYSMLLIFVVCASAGCFLDTGDEGYDVRGSITFQDDSPLYGVPVLLGTLTTRTNTDGKYVFKDVSYNSYYIEADPYHNTIYKFEPNGSVITVTEDITINFTAYRK